MKKINWENEPSTATPINAENLNEMQENIEESINGYILFENEEGTKNSIVLSDTVDNYEYIEIFFNNERAAEANEKIWSSQKVYKPNGKYTTISTQRAGSTYVYWDGQEYQIVDNQLRVLRFFNLIFTGNAVEKYINTNAYIKIFKIIGYKK